MELLEISYDLTENQKLHIIPGIILNEKKVLNEPVFDTSNFEPNSFYTLMLIHWDSSERVNEEAVTRKMYPIYWWLRNISITNRDVILSYIAPNSSEDLRQYLFLLFKQTGKQEFDEPKIYNFNLDGNLKYPLFVDLDFKNLIGGNFFYLRNEQKEAELVDMIKSGIEEDYLLKLRKEKDNKIRNENEETKENPIIISGIFVLGDLKHKLYSDAPENRISSTNSVVSIQKRRRLCGLGNKLSKLFAD